MKPKVSRVMVVEKSVIDVVNDLIKEGWLLVRFDREKALLRPDPAANARIKNAKLN